MMAASSMVSCWTREITVTSRAVGLPRFQQGRKMSAGREVDPGMREAVSFIGASAADWAAEKSTSRVSESCLHYPCRWHDDLPLNQRWYHKQDKGSLLLSSADLAYTGKIPSLPSSSQELNRAPHRG